MPPTNPERHKLLLRIVPDAQISHLRILEVTPTKCHDFARSLSVKARCDCGRIRKGYACDYLDALQGKRELFCRSCTGKKSAAARFPQPSDPELVHRVAKMLFDRHKNAAVRLGVWGQDDAGLMSSWEECIPMAAKEVECARDRLAFQKETV